LILGLLDGLERFLWNLEVFLGENRLKNRFLTQKNPPLVFPTTVVVNKIWVVTQ
jgi:hypothetical protein